MQVLHNLVSFTFHASLAFLILLPLVSSSQEHVNTNHTRNQGNNIDKMSPQLLSEITLHGFLLWASMGLLMPIGILIIKMSNREECGRRLKLLFYAHAVFQMLSVLLATAGAVMSIRNFNNTFNNSHQRIGVGLYGIIWLQALIGFLRPERGSKGRSVWFFMHWLLGTAVCLLDVISIFTGLYAYKEKTSRNIRFWAILFTVQMSLVIFFYLLQDKWVYIKKQGVVLGSEQERATNQESSQRHIYQQKVSNTEAC